MKILYFSNNYGAATTTFIRNEVEHFVKHADVRFICKEAAPAYQAKDFLTVVPFRENLVVRKVKWVLWQNDWLCNFHNPSFSKRVKNIIKEFKPDIIHCHFAYEALSLLDNIEFTNFNIIIHFHGYDATQMLRKKSYIKRLKQLFAHDNVHLISCNEYFVKLITDKIPVSPSRFHVIRYGIDLSLFRPLPGQKREKGRKTFLQVSSMAEKKGHEVTLRAFAAFLKQRRGIDSELILTGAGERKEKLMELANELQIDQYVKFIGMVTPEEAVRLMTHADVFVHHSVTASSGDMEGIPNAIIEAMAMELPIVSTIHSGIPELVEHEVNGFLVKEHDVEDYAMKMCEALQLGRLPQNREKIAKMFSVDGHNARLEELYKKVLSKEPV